MLKKVLFKKCFVHFWTNKENFLQLVQCASGVSEKLLPSFRLSKPYNIKKSANYFPDHYFVEIKKIPHKHIFIS